MAVLALLMGSVLVVPAVADRYAIWRSVTKTFADDWSGFWRRGAAFEPASAR